MRTICKIFGPSLIFLKYCIFIHILIITNNPNNTDNHFFQIVSSYISSLCFVFGVSNGYYELYLKCGEHSSSRFCDDHLGA